MALAGVTGIIGTVVFSHLNKRFGLERTGLIAFSSEIICLTLTVASIWAPGTVFDPTYSHKPNCSVTTVNTSNVAAKAADVNNLSYTIPGTDEVRVKRDLNLMLAHGPQSQHFIEGHSFSEQWRLGKDFPQVRSLVQVCYPDHDRPLSRRRRDLDTSNLLDRNKDELASNGQEQPQALAVHSLDPKTESEGDCPTSTATVSIILFLIGIITSRIGK